MDLSVIILNCNGKQYLNDCLNSIFNNTHNISYEVILVDNASTDGSVEYVRKKFSGVKLVETHKNIGISAVNIGAKEARGDYVCLLNEDIVVLPSALNRLVSFMKEQRVKTIATGEVVDFQGSHLGVGNCSRSINFLEEWLNFTFCLIKGPNPFGLRAWKKNKVQKVGAVDSAFLVMKREDMLNLGGFDENIFIFYEGHDFCLRFRKSGGQVLYYPWAKIKHFAGGTKANRKSKQINRLNRSYQSVLYVFEKHFGKFYTNVFNISVKLTVLALVVLLSLTSLSTLYRWQKATEKLRIFSHILRL